MRCTFVHQAVFIQFFIRFEEYKSERDLRVSNAHTATRVREICARVSVCITNKFKKSKKLTEKNLNDSVVFCLGFFFYNFKNYLSETESLCVPTYLLYSRNAVWNYLTAKRLRLFFLFFFFYRNSSLKMFLYTRCAF